MSLLDLFKRKEHRSAPDPSWGAVATGGMPKGVNARTAESISTVYACVQALAESVATLPLHVYHRGDTGRQRADDHWLSRLLDGCGMEFRESMTAAVLLNGNAYAQKEFNGRGEVTALQALNPGRMSIVRLDNGRHRYDYTDDAGKPVRLLQEEVLHLRDRTEPGGIVGRSRIAIARQTLGLALTVRQHGVTTFNRGARPASVLINEGTRDFTEEQVMGIKQALEDYASPANAGKTLLLPRNVKWQTIGLSNEDAQWLSAQQFGVQEICRIFRVPPILVQELTHATYSNVTELGLQFVRFSLSRWLTMWEEAISRQLLGAVSRGRYYAEHAVEGLLRAQPKERSEFYKSGIDAGWLDVDEVRALENLPRRHVEPTPGITAKS